MPTIGWIILLLALGLIVGNLLLLRDSARTRLPPETLEKIRRRQAEMEARDAEEDD
ncbi:DUF2897 family protein [Marinobacter lutaoensis]|jgi:hypothetical protein|uniref:DUF2897 domain-containing protein n=1 Tax=Marinobacter lutaoensis TaxID=135739 RepID=A0A1V2DNJ4_9GAMM|nr:DUF2897 family protein [Marinobacter lutaoensis]MBE01799.1 DUF2897 domain-containing protein [Marinobacter sp.]MBI44352.1 DUF2897 domain-containing protein [Oceanospirillales bacterium]ONF42187.1 DUF2897 domain-containing protein [Marinobacter lutaoensis]|tara:strand:+ start:4436 stop:4603 length:168 start_codon:yes stop_codon:yes gene_type:complete